MDSLHSLIHTAQGFWGEVVTVWDTAIFGVGVGRILVSLAVFLLFLFARRLFSRSVVAMLERVTRRTRSRFDDEVLAVIEEPLRFVFVVMGLYAAVQVAPLPAEANLIMTRLVRSLIAFTIFWTLYRCIGPMSFLVNSLLGVLGHDGRGESLKDFVVKLAKFVVACVGIVAVLQEWNFNVGAVLGGLGLMGMAVAFGAQNLISNMFAGLSIFLDDIFHKGDWIRTAEVEGLVEEIGFRTTKIRRFDKALTTIPNSKLAGEALVNFSRMTNRRIFWMIGVEYRTTEDQLRQIVNGIRDYVFDSDDFETDPARTSTLIHVDSFNSSSIDIMMYCFTRTTAWAEWMAAKERLAYRVKEIVEEAGTGFAFPSTSVYLEKTPFGRPEIFQAPPDDRPAVEDNSGGRHAAD